MPGLGADNDRPVVTDSDILKLDEPGEQKPSNRSTLAALSCFLRVQAG